MDGLIATDNKSWLSSFRMWTIKNGKSIVFWGIFAYIVAFCIVLWFRSVEIGIRYHEIDSYALPMISIQYRGSFIMHISDLSMAQRDFGELYGGVNSWETLRSARLLVSESDPDVWYSYYFPIYSVLCLPAKLVLQLLGLEQKLCFTVTNVILIWVALAVIFLFSKMPQLMKLGYILLLTFAPLEQYCSYIGAEIMIFSFLAMALAFYYDRAYCRAGILVSIASFANPTVLLFGLVMIVNYIVCEVVLYYKKRQELSAKQIVMFGFCKLAKLGICYLLVFIPFIFNYINLGVINPTLGGADFTILHYRVLMYLFDLNFGYASYAPILILLTAVALPFLLVTKKFNVLWYYLSFAVTVIAFSVMLYINCGMFYCSRYIIWSHSLLAFLSIVIISELKLNKYAKTAIVVLSVAVTATVMTINGGSTSHTNLNNITQYIIDRAPALYSPLHSTFYSRDTAPGSMCNTPWDSLPQYSMHCDSRNSHIRKLLVHGSDEAKAALLARCGMAKGDIEDFKAALDSVPNDDAWHYLNISPNSEFQVVVANYSYGQNLLFHTAHGTREDGYIVLDEGGLQFGPYDKLPGGRYKARVYGYGLENAYFDVSTDKGVNVIQVENVSVYDGYAEFEFYFEGSAQFLEIRTYNFTEDTKVAISGMDVTRIIDTE